MLFSTPFITIYVCTFQFIFGAVFAGFLGRYACRLCKGKSIVKECCKCCGKKIAPACLVGEVVLAVLFVLCTLHFDLTGELFLALVLLLVLYVITLTDLQERIIPNRCVMAAILIRFLYFLVTGEGSFKQFLWLIGQGLILSVPVFLVTLLTETILKKEALGGGDIKLLFVLGMYLGSAKSLFMLLMACILGIIGGVVSMKKTEAGESVTIPFGPYLSAGAVLALLFGDPIITAYLSLFL